MKLAKQATKIERWEQRQDVGLTKASLDGVQPPGTKHSKRREHLLNWGNSPQRLSSTEKRAHDLAKRKY